MKIGVFYPSKLPLSVRNYIDHIVMELSQINVESFLFSEDDEIPSQIDAYWDPRALGGDAPYKKFATINKPLIVTVHGASPFSLPAKEHYPNLKSSLRAQFFKLKKLYGWRQFRNQRTTIIAVSAYGKSEINKHLRLNRNKITAIWHGVDLDIFKPCRIENSKSVHPYFLHISQYQPLKNIDRIIEAYTMLPGEDKPALAVVAPGYPKLVTLPEGVELIRTTKNQQELENLYQNAVAFLLPSLRESFGMPIIEAMATGCPVITSNVSACPEVAGDAALLVNPRSTNDIAVAMERVMTDQPLASSLRARGLLRAQQFTWQRSAEEHLKVFENAIRDANKP